MSDLSKFDLSEKINTVQEQKRDAKKLSKDLERYQMIGFATVVGGVVLSVPVLSVVGICVAATALTLKEYLLPLQKERTMQAQKDVLNDISKEKQEDLDVFIKEFKEYNKSRKKVFKTYMGTGALLSAPLIINARSLTDTQAIIGIVCVTIAAGVAAWFVNKQEKKKTDLYELREGIVNNMYVKSLREKGFSDQDVPYQIKNKL